MPVPAGSSVRFGDFVLDLETGELRSNGDRTYLQEKPFQILTLLLEHPGQLVTRDQLRRKLWSTDTFVDFDQSLNKAVNRLREALGDSAEEPRFIETLPRRGYRFIAQVENQPVTGTRSETAPPVPQDVGNKTTALEKRFAAALMLGLVVVVVVVVRSFNRPKRGLELKETSLTASSSDLPVTSDAISPDGKYLAYSDTHGIHVKLLATGETSTLSDVPSEASFAWFPDSTRFFASQVFQPGIMAFSVTGGAPYQFREDGTVSGISPDGSLVSFTTNKGRVGDREIWIIGADGKNPHKFLGMDDDSALQEPSWTPDGQRLWYLLQRQARDRLEVMVESRDLQGGPPVALYSESALTPERMRLQDFVWLPEGRVIFSLAAPDSDLVNAFSAHCNLWELRVNPTTGQPLGPMRRVTNWPSGTDVVNLYATADGKKLSVFRMSSTISLFVADLAPDGRRISTPKRFTATEGWNGAPVWTADSRKIIFESTRDGHVHLFGQDLSSNTAQPALPESATSSVPTLSPDGSFLLYVASAHPTVSGSSLPAQIMRVPMNGGTPTLLLTAYIYDSPRCARAPATLCAIAEPSPDRKKLIFTALDPVNGRGRELARIDADPDADYAWDLSPDGTRVAVLRRVPRFDGKIETSKGPIHVLSLNGEPERDVRVRGKNDFRTYVDWSADGKNLILASLATGGPELITTNLLGHAKVLWRPDGPFPFRAVSSPDGRHLVILCRGDSNNVSLLENF